jgi:hypothetical protein
VYHDGEWEARALKCGPTNDKFFVIERGLEEGERVAMNPRAFVEEVKLPALPPEKKQQVVQIHPEMPAETTAVAKDAVAAPNKDKPEAAEKSGATEPTAG